MMLQAHQLDNSSAMQSTLTHCGIDMPSGGVQDCLVAEYLRQNLRLLAAPPGSALAAQPVYVTKLTGRVRAQLCPLWPDLDRRSGARPSQREQEHEGDTEPDPIGRVLDALQDVRDVAEVGNGYWLPIPTRFVEFESGVVLVVSGLGTRDLTARLKTPITYTQICRTVRGDDLPSRLRDNPSLWQPLNWWLGMWDDTDLETWTAQILARASTQLKQSASGVTEFEVYTPLPGSGEPQYFRWTPAERLQHIPADLVLCRSAIGRYRPRIYWLGILSHRHGVTSLRQESPVEPTLVRRLLYGLDQRYQAPTHANVEIVEDGQRITLRSWLPPEERRLFLALTRNTARIPNRMPLLYHVAPAYGPDLLQALQALGIQIDLRNGRSTDGNAAGL